MNKVFNSFIDSEPGSLWKSKFLKLGGKWAGVVKFEPKITLFTDLHNATSLIPGSQLKVAWHKAELNKNYFLVEAGAPILNLKKELILDGIKADNYRKRTIGEKRVANRFDSFAYCYKVLTMTDVGEHKIGWIFREDAELLVPYEDKL